MANQKSVFVPARGWRGKRCEIKKKLLEDGKDGGRGEGELGWGVAESTDVAEEVPRKQMSQILQLQSVKINTTL